MCGSLCLRFAQVGCISNVSKLVFTLSGQILTLCRTNCSPVLGITQVNFKCFPPQLLHFAYSRVRIGACCSRASAVMRTVELRVGTMYPFLDCKSRFGDKVLENCMICPKNGTAVLNGLSHLLLRGAIVNRTKYC